MKAFASLLLVFFLAGDLEAKPRQVRVFVALCDNKTQGIQPVGERIGNGDDPDANLYWGCSDGFGSLFRRSKHWKVLSSESDVSPAVLRRMTLRHKESDVEVTAEAYRGSEMKKCLADFEAAAASGTYDLVAFIGHNGLMDFSLDPPKPAGGNRTEAVVLCCLSDSYFSSRLRAAGCRPILMTAQLMYPGAFLLDAALEQWRSGNSLDSIREAAARAYAKNQGISVAAAKGVFAKIQDSPASPSPTTP